MRSQAAVCIYSESLTLKPLGYRVVTSTSGRDKALSDYVRMKIREWLETNGRDQKELARRVGVSPSLISTIISGKIGVAGRSGPGFASAFGFANFDELRSAAYGWWLQQGQQTETFVADEPAVAESIEIVLGMRADVTKAQVLTILHAYTHERFRGRDQSFWVPELLRELQFERAVTQEKTAEANAVARDKRSRKANIHGALRAEHRRRKARDSEEPSPPAPASTKSVAKGAAG